MSITTVRMSIQFHCTTRSINFKFILDQHVETPLLFGGDWDHIGVLVHQIQFLFANGVDFVHHEQAGDVPENLYENHLRLTHTYTISIIIIKIIIDIKLLSALAEILY